MPYTPKTWENKPSTASPINATNLNHMEGGIKTNDDNILGAQNAILTLQGEMLQAQGDISALETLVDSIFPVDTETGNPAVITDAFGGACKSLKLTLEPIQSGSGTPSPQNVRPISGRTQSVVTRCGKNVLPVTLAELKSMNTSGTWNGDTYTRREVDFVVLTDADGYVTGIRVNGTAGAGNAFLRLAPSTFDIPAGAVLDGCPSTGTYETYCIIAYKSDDATIAGTDSGSGVTFDTSVADSNVYIRVAMGTNVPNLLFKPMLRLASTTDTTYEPYISESITRTYGATIYGGTDDVTGDGAIKTKDLYVPVVSSVGYSPSAGCNYADCHSITIVEDSDTICNMYDQIPYGNTGAEGKYKVYPSAITIYDNRFTDVATAQTILNGCQIVYPLYTPTSIPLTAQNITLLHGDNVLTTDADSIEASYNADIALYIDKKIAEGSQNNRGLSKGGSSDEEVKEKVKEEEIEIKEEEPLTKEVR